MFRIQTSLKGLKAIPSVFSPELLFSAFPPEPATDIQQKTVGEFRHYDNKHFEVFLTGAGNDDFKVDVSFGDALGGEPLAPVAPFGDGKPISGSEKWPTDMVGRMQKMLSSGKVSGFLLYRSPPAEYETKPFFIDRFL